MSAPRITAPTVGAMLAERAAERPDALALRFLVDGEHDEIRWTYAELDGRARAIALRLRNEVSIGAPVLLMYPPGLDYVAAFFGCLYAGAIPVPAYPPDPGRLQRTLPRLRAIVADSGAAVALGTAMICGLADQLIPGGPAALRWIATDALGMSDAAAHDGAPGDVAFIQYTSGSTARPRGVVLTHDNLMHNLAAIAERCPQDGAPSSLVWLPPYHDMGLIGGILGPIAMGMPGTLMSPLHFLQRPSRWLQGMSRLGCTFSAAPAFAYDLCVRKTTPEQRAALDLSRWAVSFNGAEPIHADSLRGFADAFAVSGFKVETFLPCYGLAESSLIVSGEASSQRPVIVATRPGSVEAGVARTAEDGAGTEQVGCGPAIEGHTVRVVDPDTHAACPDGVVGEIRVRGPSVARGYWRQPEASAATFDTIVDGHGGGFMRTGDLGFMRAGELFVTGRRKDLIIIAGRNVYPQDVERAALDAHVGLRAGAAAAFSVTVDRAERLVVVCEAAARRTTVEARAAMTAAIRAAVIRAQQVAPYAVLIAPRGGLPRTSSGKIQRYRCREAWQRGDWAEGA